MNKKKSLLWAMSFVAVRAFAQVGIGTEKPDPAAMLDVASQERGVLIPRVELRSITFDLDGLPGQPKGLLVYNTGVDLAGGFYFWNGVEWENLESSSVIAPQIATLECNHAILEPPTFRAHQPYIGILKVPYTGGNGGKYPAGANIAATSGNTSLTACLRAGRLEAGRGYLLYDVTGTPGAGSPVGATFPIVFGDKSGEAKVGYTESATMTSTFSIGDLVPLSDGTGHQRVVTSFDGKFSVRCFVDKTNPLTSGRLQIRHNTPDSVAIMWNGLTSKTVLYGTAGNQFILHPSKTWYPSPGTWGTEYFTTAEQRSYIWTTTDVKDKTVYHLTFMLAAPGSGNKENCNVFLKIEQIQAN
ncbi:MAG: hypothetical protein LBS88_13255 [Tannerellaceae bacterium]|jgi:hypothetical protein|nr:hypothetical protein [Tannerellaceae bacterium]